MKLIIKEHNTKTNEIIEREMTDEEQTEYLALRTKYLVLRTNRLLGGSNGTT